MQPERHPSLIDQGSIYILVAGPCIWAAHFLLCYWIAAIFCAKVALAAQLSFGVQVAIWALTALALLGVLGIALHARRHYRAEFLIHEEMTEDTKHERKAFTGHVALLLCLISAIAIVFTAIPTLVVPTC